MSLAVSKTKIEQFPADPPCRILLSPIPPHIIFCAKIYGKTDYKHYLKIKSEFEKEEGVKCAEVLITRAGEFRLIQPDEIIEEEG